MDIGKIAQLYNDSNLQKDVTFLIIDLILSKNLIGLC